MTLNKYDITTTGSKKTGTMSLYENMHIRSLFLLAIINIFFQVIFPNIIRYLDRTFEEGKNYMKFQFEIILV